MALGVKGGRKALLRDKRVSWPRKYGVKTTARANENVRKSQ